MKEKYKGLLTGIFIGAFLILIIIVATIIIKDRHNEKEKLQSLCEKEGLRFIEKRCDPILSNLSDAKIGERCYALCGQEIYYKTVRSPLLYDAG